MNKKELDYFQHLLRCIADHDQDERVKKPDTAFVHEICDTAHRALAEWPFVKNKEIDQ